MYSLLEVKTDAGKRTHIFKTVAERSQTFITDSKTAKHKKSENVLLDRYIYPSKERLMLVSLVRCLRHLLRDLRPASVISMHL